MNIIDKEYTVKKELTFADTNGFWTYELAEGVKLSIMEMLAVIKYADLDAYEFIDTFEDVSKKEFNYLKDLIGND